MIVYRYLDKLKDNHRVATITCSIRDGILLSDIDKVFQAVSGRRATDRGIAVLWATNPELFEDDHVYAVEDYLHLLEDM